MSPASGGPFAPPSWAELSAKHGGGRATQVAVPDNPSDAAGARDALTLTANQPAPQPVPSGPTFTIGGVDMSTAAVLARQNAPQPVSVDGTTPIGLAQATIEQSLDAYSYEIDALDRSRYSPEGLNDRLKEIGKGPLEAISHAENVATQTLRTAEQQREQVLQSLSPNGDTAAELRATRQWARDKAILDAASDGGLTQVAANMLRTSTVEQLGVRLQEMDAYLTARGARADFINPVAAQVSPEYGQAIERVNRAEQSAAVIKSNARRAAEHIRQGTKVVVPLVDARAYDPDR